MEREPQQKTQAQPWTEIFSSIELYLIHLSHNPTCGLISSTVDFNSWRELVAGEIALRSSMDV